MSVGVLRDAGPLAPGRKPRTPATAQAALCEDVYQPCASGWALSKAALVVVDVLVTRRLTRPRGEPRADCWPSPRRSRDGRSYGVQFNGPEVTSCPVIWPPPFRTAGEPVKEMVRRTVPQTA